MSEAIQEKRLHLHQTTGLTGAMVEDCTKETDHCWVDGQKEKAMRQTGEIFAVSGTLYAADAGGMAEALEGLAKVLREDLHGAVSNG